MIAPDRDTFRRLAATGNVVPLVHRLMSDQLTPVLAYRRLVAPDERTAPSFLFESVEGGRMVGRFSFLGSQPEMEVIARGSQVTVRDHARGTTHERETDDPLAVPRELTAGWRPVTLSAADAGGLALPAFGGWVGSVGYDTMRYMEPDKLPFSAAPFDDRELPDLHMALYRNVAVFDNVAKVLHVIHHVVLDDGADIDAAYDDGVRVLEAYVDRLERQAEPIPPGAVTLDIRQTPTAAMKANFTRADFESAVETTRDFIAAGDAFQVVLSQRFERLTSADPFEIYRALRIVNPSPYMFYLQGEGAILVGSSPEILCHCEGSRVVNRPLAGTRKRGRNEEEDLALERELRADAKECAEHVMLVDLGRNDLGRVCEIASVEVERVMEIERYSHVMHLSSTVTGTLNPALDGWDLLRSTLPVGTVSGAPKVRAMQIIDELEPTRRGPYAGGVGHVGFGGDTDIAIALRTMVIPTAHWSGGDWTVHLQAGAGIVADSVPASEYDETVNKAAALGRAIDLAEQAFGNQT